MELYSDTVTLQTYEHGETTAAAAWPPRPLQLVPPPPSRRTPCFLWRRLARLPLACRRLRPTGGQLRRRGSLRLCRWRRWPRRFERSGFLRHRFRQHHVSGGDGCPSGGRERTFPCGPLTGGNAKRERGAEAPVLRSGGGRLCVTFPGLDRLGGHPQERRRQFRSVIGGCGGGGSGAYRWRLCGGACLCVTLYGRPSSPHHSGAAHH